MSELLTPDSKFDVALTDDSNLDGAADRAVRPWREVEAYLNSDPRHAVVLHSGYDDYFELTPFDPPIYVLRGAGEDLNNFYWGDMPAEDPNDAEGGDLTAEQALAYSCGRYYE